MMRRQIIVLTVVFGLISCTEETPPDPEPAKEPAQQEQTVSADSIAQSVSNPELKKDEGEEPEQEELGMPVLSDTSSYRQVRAHIIELNEYYMKNRHLRDSIIPTFWKLCPIYYEGKDSVRAAKAESVRNRFNALEEKNTTNYTFLKKMLQPEDTISLAYEKPLGAVFQGVKPTAYIFETDPNSPADKKMLERVKDLPEATVVNPSFLEYSLSYPLSGNKDSVFVFTKRGKYKTAVSSFAYTSETCIEYYHYKIDDVEGLNNNEEILLTSTYDLELEYEWNEELDHVLTEAYQEVCNDCPNSQRYQKSFAKLKDYGNFYLTYTREAGKKTDDTYGPQRSLIYYDGELLYTIWTMNIDLFRCSCL